MAGRVLSRRALRDQHDRSEEIEREDEAAEGGEPPAAPPKARKPRARKPAAAKPAGPKAPAGPRARKKAVRVPPRVFARWAVCDGGLKRVAVFDYRDRAGADARLAEVRQRKAGSFVLLLVKDPYDPPAAEPVPAV